MWCFHWWYTVIHKCGGTHWVTLPLAVGLTHLVLSAGLALAPLSIHWRVYGAGGGRRGKCLFRMWGSTSIAPCFPRAGFLFFLFSFLLFFNIVLFYWIIIDLHCYISFTCTIEWFEIFFAWRNDHSVWLSFVTIRNYYYAVHYIPVSYLFCNWKCVPFNPLHLFRLSPTTCGQSPLWSSVSESLLMFSFLCSFVLLFRFYI